MENNIKVGDKVRYLNAVGGGVVRGFRGKDIVLVEEEDGFETPVLKREVVVVKETNQYNFPIEERVKHEDEVPVSNKVQVVEDTEEEEFKEPEYTWNERNETEEGEKLSLYLAFVPENIKQLQTSNLDLYLVNDSNYYLSFSIFNGNGKVELRAQNSIEPQTKLFIESIDRQELNDIQNLRFQAVAYKKIPFDPKPVVDVPLTLDLVKFYKLHSFVENDFFDEDAMLVTLIKNDILDFAQLIDPAVLQKAIAEKKHSEQHRHPQIKKDKKIEIEEIDLHSQELLDTTAGMSRRDILTYQLEIFEKKIGENLRFKGKRIVFIHGKGEGVLRAEIEKLLKRKYPRCEYQDASFQKYGYGATMVIIH